MSSNAFTRRDFLASSADRSRGGRIGPAGDRARVADAATSTAAATPAPQATPVFTPIRRNVGYFTMRGGTIGYLIDPTGVVVVDSQYPAEAKVCLDGLNERSKNRPVALLINTHHHHDHSDGNISFSGVAKKVVVAREGRRAHEGTRRGDRPPTTEQLYPDTTFDKNWSESVGDEKRVRAKFYGPAHTSGDVVVTFERANVAHMGDLTFNQRHPVVDRAAGASIKNWIEGARPRCQSDHAKRHDLHLRTRQHRTAACRRPSATLASLPRLPRRAARLRAGPDQGRQNEGRSAGHARSAEGLRDLRPLWRHGRARGPDRRRRRVDRGLLRGRPACWSR